MNKPDVSKIFNSVKQTLSARSPEILIGLGVTGMITTVVLAVRATPKALELIKEKKETKENGLDLTPVETVKTAWKPYVPAAVTGVFSTACIIGANSVNARRNAALATAYKLSETALTEYREKVIETIGEKKEKVVREKVAEEQVKKQPVSSSEVYITNKGNTLCLDPISGRYFKSDIERIKRAENALNKRMLHDITGYASLNEFYGELGLEYSSIGDDLGWNTDNLIDIDFGTTLADDDTPCIVLDYRTAPKYGYSRFV